MCGVFSVVQKEGGRAIDLDALMRVATVTARRGHHAWGLAWLNRRGRLCYFKRRGSITGALPMLRMAEGARAVIGHCRYATAGHPDQQINNHPFPCDGGFIVHNGQVGMTRSLREEYGLLRVSECDTEFIALLVERLDARGGMIGRLALALELLGRPRAVVLGLWKPGRVIAARRGNPLYFAETPDAYWLASLADELPGAAEEVPDGADLTITKRGYDL